MPVSKEDVKKMIDMDLGEKMILAQTDHAIKHLIRVPGGWIWSVEVELQGMNSVFIPLPKIETGLF